MEKHTCESRYKIADGSIRQKIAIAYSKSGKTQYKIEVCHICGQHLGVISSQKVEK